MKRMMLFTRLATGFTAMLAALVVLPAYPANAAGAEPSLAAQSFPSSAVVPASVLAAAAVDGEVCDAGRTYRSQVFRTDTKRVVYKFNVLVRKCAVGDLAYVQELAFDTTPVRDPEIFDPYVSFASLPGRPPQSVPTYQIVLLISACFGNPCQYYRHTFFGTSTSIFQTGSFAFERTP